MNTVKSLLSLAFSFVIFMTLSHDVYAQEDARDTGELPDVYSENMTFERSTNPGRRVIPYHYLREADAVYVRRIERVIDTREKQNLTMRWPRNPLSAIIYEAALNGDIQAFSNDSLTTLMTEEEVRQRGGWEELIEFQPDPDDPYYFEDSTIVNELRSEDIVRFRVIEEWIFDKQRSTFFPRIISIAPLFQMIAGGQELGEQVLFYARYDELRELLVNEPMYNRHNDAQQMTYYDFFEHRLFSSYIVKEPNEFDLRITQFEEFSEDDYAALLESERIRHDLLYFEMDLWHY